jgi:hypothetical protein
MFSFSLPNCVKLTFPPSASPFPGRSEYARTRLQQVHLQSHLIAELYLTLSLAGSLPSSPSVSPYPTSPKTCCCLSFRHDCCFRSMAVRPISSPCDSGWTTLTRYGNSHLGRLDRFDRVRDESYASYVLLSLSLCSTNLTLHLASQKSTSSSFSRASPNPRPSSVLFVPLLSRPLSGHSNTVLTSRIPALHPRLLVPPSRDWPSSSPLLHLGTSSEFV